uniref:Uncharacterized protein n=1 Tax=Globodera rostochiensis TaxID=31243 RepID=A0A914GQN8_GLORO
MLLLQIVLLCFCAGFLQGKPTENNAEIKPATITETRNEIKSIAPIETARNEIKAIAPIETRIGTKTAPIRADVLREIKTAMDFLNNNIREYSEKIKNNKEEFNGIIEARNKLESAIKPLHGVAEADAAASNLESVMTSSVKTAQLAVEDLTVKQVKQMEQIAEEGKTRNVEEQERALNEFADKHGDNVKKAVHEVFEAKAKADIALENYLRSHSETLSPEARKANEQMLIVMQDKKLAVGEKLQKLEEYVSTLPDFVRGELNVRDMREMKQLVQTHVGLTPVLHAGFAGGL